MADPRTSERQPPYRPDIDGLRALAVLAVIGFHASPRFIPGGFVGVDIFFVVSGFLISGIIFDQLSTGTFTFRDFYTRRIRRIFPALAIVLVACWAFGWFALVADEYTQLMKHIGGAATFTSNFVLWREAGYFDAPSDAKPLLHLWSLGIEEQFYLLWPPILVLCWKRGLNVLSVIVVLLAVSFALNVALISTAPVADFYLPAGRMWELLLGALLAYSVRFLRPRLDDVVERVVFKREAPPDRRAIANLKAWIGLALIGLAILALGKSTAYPGWWFGVPVADDLAAAFGLSKGPSFPGWWAILPTIGTAFVIWAGPDAFLNRAILARKGLVQLGLISYPLYLWHWPMLSFLGITEAGHPSQRLRLSAVLLACALARLTYQCIERPIRRAVSVRTPRRVFAIAGTLAVVGALAIVAQSTGAIPPRTPAFASAVPPRIIKPVKEPACRQRFQTNADYCKEYLEGLRVTTALVGDSHAERWLPAVGSYLARRGENVVLVGQSGCPPLLGIQTVNPAERNSCDATDETVLKGVAADRNITRVILAFRGAFETTGAYRLAGTTLDPTESMKRALLATVDYLRANRKSVWLFVQVPELNFDIAECVARPFSFEHRGRTPCAVAKRDVLQQQAPFRHIVDTLTEHAPDVRVFDPLPWLCDDQWCAAIKAGRTLYSDAHHLSPEGSLLFSDKFTF
jgi:peptidoglycan/LPS O-acetylase OafA/YrhL